MTYTDYLIAADQQGSLFDETYDDTIGDWKKEANGVFDDDDEYNKWWLNDWRKGNKPTTWKDDKETSKAKDGKVVVKKTYTPTTTSKFWKPPIGLLDEIIPRVYFGSVPNRPGDMTKLTKMGITHILDVAYDYTYALAPDIVRLENGTSDDGYPKGLKWFERSVDFILEALGADDANKVFIHCSAGISRSSSTTFAVLLALGYDAKVAEDLIYEGRPGSYITYRRDAIKAMNTLGYADVEYQPEFWNNLDYDHDGYPVIPGGQSWEKDDGGKLSSRLNPVGWLSFLRRNAASALNSRTPLTKSGKPIDGSKN